MFERPEISSIRSDLVVGNNAFWDDATNSVYYNDLFGRAFYRYSYDKNKVYKTVVDKYSFATFIQPIQGRKNRFLVGLNGTVVKIKWNGRSSTATRVRDIFTIAPKTNFNSFTVGPNNDFITGGFGNAFCANPSNVSLYQYDAVNDDLISSVSRGRSIIGLVVNEKKNILYLLEACTKVLYAYDYDAVNRDLCKAYRIFFLFKDHRTIYL